MVTTVGLLFLFLLGLAILASSFVVNNVPAQLQEERHAKEEEMRRNSTQDTLFYNNNRLVAEVSHNHNERSRTYTCR